MDSRGDLEALLDTAEELFYERGYQAVGMDALRSASQVSLKRIYSLFKGKESIAVAMLERRDETWHSSLATHLDQETDPGQRLLAIFDWLEIWLANEGHRGCAWINAFGELGGTSPAVTAVVRQHKDRLRSVIHGLAAEAAAPPGVADAVFLLAEGCMVTTGITGETTSVSHAKETTSRLLHT